MYIIGSHAAKQWGMCTHTPKDLDVLGDVIPELLPEHTRLEVHTLPDNIMEYIDEHNMDPLYLSPNLLYTLKVSHAAWNIHWDKTMFDIYTMGKHGCKLDYQFYKMLFSHWEVFHKGKHFTMNSSNDEFFSDAVKRTIPHDVLHEMVSYPNRPLNEQFRKHADSPLFDTVKWESASHELKAKCTVEELCVIAIERFLFTSIRNCSIIKTSDVKIAFSRAAKQFITTMTKGSYNLWLILNYRDIMLYSGIATEVIKSTIERIKTL